MVRPVINSVKHLVQRSIETVLASAIVTTFLIVAKNVVDVNTSTEVVEGSIIKAVYVEWWLRAGDLAGGSYVFILYKGGSDMTAPTTTEMAALNDWDNKKNILFTSQALVNDQDADATPILRQWVKIPKGKQRFGLGDHLKISVFAQGAIDLHQCGVVIYKEYR